MANDIAPSTAVISYLFLLYSYIFIIFKALVRINYGAGLNDDKMNHSGLQRRFRSDTKENIRPSVHIVEY